MKKFEYIKEASPSFGSLRQIPEMKEPDIHGYESKGFFLTDEDFAFIESTKKYQQELSRMPLYPLSVQPSEEWMQRKEYEEGVDFEFGYQHPNTEAIYEYWGARGYAEYDISSFKLVVIPIEKKGDLVASQNHPQPESSVATLACTDGNSIEQIAERLFPYNEAVVNGEEINKLSKQLVDRRRRDFTNGFYYCDENRKHLRLLLIEAQETIKELQEENDRFKSLLKKESL